MDILIIEDFIVWFLWLFSLLAVGLFILIIIKKKHVKILTILIAISSIICLIIMVYAFTYPLTL
ncbi:MAG: hypothetical protein ACTSQO_12625 [Candidatus Helarchaeota archaeon]